MDGLSRRPDCDALYVRYWDASLPKPRDVNSFEYTLLSKFLSWARPESFRLEGAVSSQGDLRPENAVRSAGDFRSEGAVSSEGDPRSEGGFRDIEPPVNTASPPRRSSRLTASSSKMPVRAAVLQHKRLLHVLHKHIPLRLTKRRKNGSIVMVSKSKAIQRVQQDITPASMKQALSGPDAEKWKEARDAEHRSLEENQTFQYVSRSEVPQGSKIIKSLY